MSVSLVRIYELRNKLVVAEMAQGPGVGSE